MKIHQLFYVNKILKLVTVVDGDVHYYALFYLLFDLDFQIFIMLNFMCCYSLHSASLKFSSIQLYLYIAISQHKSCQDTLQCKVQDFTEYKYIQYNVGNPTVSLEQPYATVERKKLKMSVCLWEADVSLSFSCVIIPLETTSIFTISHSQLCFLSRFFVVSQSQQQQQLQVTELISTNVTQVLNSTVSTFFFFLYIQ